MPINPKINEPQPPHDCIDLEDCICGALYKDHRCFVGSSKARFSEVASRLRIAFGGFESGGGYRGRGTILYMMRIMKIADWYECHVFCNGLLENQHVMEQPEQLRMEA